MTGHPVLRRDERLQDIEHRDNQLVVAVSSSALFDLVESDKVFREKGVSAYRQYQIENEGKPLTEGYAFHLVAKLLGLNQMLEKARVEVILLSKNTADTGLRVFNSIQHHGLQITRAAFSGGRAPHRYAPAFGCQLFLSTDLKDVQLALREGVAAARLMYTSDQPYKQDDNGELRIAFDGDAVLFSDEAEQVYQRQGLADFQETEQMRAREPLPGGPLKPFLKMLNKIQTECEENSSIKKSPVRTALVTARSAPSHERAIRTLRHWNVHLDEALFLGDLPKDSFLRAFGANIFFDDQRENCEAASDHITTGFVPAE